MQEALSSFALNLSLIHRDVSLHKKLSKSNIQVTKLVIEKLPIKSILRFVF